MQCDALVSCLADDKKHDVTTIVNTLEHYAKGQINETVEHHNLLSRVQQPRERFLFGHTRAGVHVQFVRQLHQDNLTQLHCT